LLQRLSSTQAYNLKTIPGKLSRREQNIGFRDDLLLRKGIRCIHRFALFGEPGRNGPTEGRLIFK